MKFTEPLHEGRFLKRYKRFFADIEWNGQTIIAHVPNTGSLKSCLLEGAPCLFSESKDPARKLKFTLQMIQSPKSWIGVNTALSNGLVWEAFEEKRVKGWMAFDRCHREAKINDQTRIDLALWSSKTCPEVDKFHSSRLKENRFHFIEVKNVTLCDGETAQFPDAVTTRGQKHLEELMKLIDKGHTSEIVFTIQRTDFGAFCPADDIDPEYGRLLRKAQKKGVKITPFSCDLTPQGIRLNTERTVPLEL